MRISDHFLEIERGRYKNIKREDRLCKYCTLEEVEDESHFFLHCPKYDKLRCELYKNINNIYPDFDILNDENKVEMILSNHIVMSYLVPFLNKSLELRRMGSKPA